MKELIIASAALTLLGAMPALAASSSSSGSSRGAASGAQMNPGARMGNPGMGTTAPNTGPGTFQSRTPYTPTAPPVPGSAQDPYGNSASGSSTGTSGGVNNSGTSGAGTSPAR